MVDSTDQTKDRILSISFNQDQGCFACGTERGMRVYNTVPYKGTFYRILDAGIGAVSMLYRTNIMALIGGGTHPKYPLNKVMLWDDRQKKCIGELSFKTVVKAVKMRRERIAVVLEQRIYIYQFSDLKMLEFIDTCPNPLGLCALSSRETMLLVCPHRTKGVLYMVNYDTNVKMEKKAHESFLTSIVLSPDAKLCATSSDKGTLIRVFSTEGGKLVQELRRGADKAEIQSLAFDSTGNWLACSSDKGTVHVFSTMEANRVVNKIALDSVVGTVEQPRDVKNPTSVFKFMKGLVSYFSSEWSLAQFKIPEHRALVAFGEPGKPQIVGTLRIYHGTVVVTHEGKYYRAEFDPKVGGECRKIEERSLFTDT